MSNQDQIPRNIANFVGLAVEWTLYGTTLPLLAITLHELLRPLRSRRKPHPQPSALTSHPHSNTLPPEPLNKQAIILTLTFWVLCTLIVTLDLVEDVQNVVAHLHDETRPLTTQSFFTPIRRVRQTAYIFITLLADGIVALRAFIVWKLKIAVAVVPWILFAFVLVSAIVCSAFIGMGHNGSKSDLQRATLAAMAFFGASLASNALSTGLLAFKIYSVNRGSSHFRITTSPLLSFVRVAIDSGLIYTISLSLTISAYVGKFLWKEVLLDTMPSVICIAFYLMLIRIARTTRNKPPIGSVFNSEDMALRGFSVNDTTASTQAKEDIES